MSLSPEHAKLVSALSEPATPARLEAALDGASVRDRLALASAVARAAQASGCREARPAWCVAVAALRSLAPALSVRDANSKSSPPAGVDVYAALYALAVAEDPRAPADEADHAQRQAADVLRKALAPAPRPRRGRPRVRSDPAELGDASLLDRTLFSGAAAVGWDRLLPGHGANGSVVVPALIARLRGGDAALRDRVSVARAVLKPWLKALDSSRAVEAYQRKARAMLLNCVDSEGNLPADVFRARVASVTLFPVSRHEFARTVHRAANVFLRGGTERDYLFVASTYEDALSFLPETAEGNLDAEDASNPSEDECAWFDHILTTYCRTGSARYQRLACALAVSRVKVLKNSKYFVAAECQRHLVWNGFYGRDRHSFDSDATFVDRVGECLMDCGPVPEAYVRAVHPTDQFSETDGSAHLRLLRVLEPVRSVVCAEKKRTTLHEAWEHVLLGYVRYVRLGRNAPRKVDSVQSRLLAMVPAAMSTCETLLKVSSYARDTKRMEEILHECISLAREVRLTCSDSDAAQWARWLSGMLKMQGVDLYNRHARYDTDVDATMRCRAASLLEIGAEWHVLGSLSLKDGNALDFRCCWCGSIPAPVAVAYATRALTSADAYLSAGPQFYKKSLEVITRALHCCCSSSTQAPREVLESFSRAAFAVASGGTETFWQILDTHQLLGSSLLSVNFAALAAIQFYVASKRRRVGREMEYSISFDEAGNSALQNKVAQRVISGDVGDAKIAAEYTVARLRIGTGNASGLECASEFSRCLSVTREENAHTLSSLIDNLARLWLAVEGLDLSRLQETCEAIDHALRASIRREASVNLVETLVFCQTLELAEWASYTLLLHDMDELAVSVCQIVENACHCMQLPRRRSPVAELYRRLGWVDRCWASIGEDETSGPGECVSVHGRILLDLNRFADAEAVVDQRSDPDSCEVLAEVALFDRGEIFVALEKTLAAVKLLTTELKVLSKASQCSGVVSVRIAGVDVHSSDDVRTVLGRQQHMRLVALANNISRLASLHNRLGSLRDAHYYASKACELLKTLSAASVYALSMLAYASLPAAACAQAKSGDTPDIPVTVTEYFGQLGEAESMNLITLLRLRLSQAAQFVEQSSLEQESGSTTSDALDVLDDARRVICSMEDVDEVDGDVVNSFSHQVHSRLGRAYFAANDLQSALDAYERASHLSARSREDRLCALIGCADVYLAQGETTACRKEIRKALNHVKERPVGDSRLTRRLWKLVAEVEMRGFIAVSPADARFVTHALLNAHGTSLAFRSLARNTQSSDGLVEDELADALRGIRLDDSACSKRLAVGDTNTTPQLLKLRAMAAPSVLAGMSLSADRRTLVLWRVSRSASATSCGVIRRSIPAEGPLSADAVEQRFNRIHAEMKAMSIGEGVLSRAEKSSWWEQRFSLDHDLGELMAEIEEHWLGSARSLLLPAAFTAQASEAFTSFGLNHDFSVVPDCLVSSAVAAMVEFPEIFSSSDASALARDVLGKRRKDAEGGISAKSVLEDINALSGQSNGTSSRPQTRRPSTRRTRSSPKPEMELLTHCTTACQLYLAIGTELEQLPWESLPVLRASKSAVVRLPSSTFLPVDSNKLTVDASKVFYLLNPSGDLDVTQRTFEKSFSARKGWRGVSGGRPEAQDVSSNVSSLESSDVFVYCGHGGGEAFVPPRRLSRASSLPVSILMGCSSGRLQRFSGDAESDGTPHDYLLAGAPAVVANLWDVSDRDIDRLTADLLARWLPEKKQTTKAGRRGAGSSATAGPHASDGDASDEGVRPQSLASALAHARDACRLPYLVGAATVIYGRGDIYSK